MHDLIHFDDSSALKIHLKHSTLQFVIVLEYMNVKMAKLYFMLLILAHSSVNMNCEPPFEKIPLGDQNISIILKNNKIYIDKTKFAFELITSNRHYFMSRPRKFGKTTFLDTLKEILAGNKDLFKDCDIAKLKYPWDKHAILHFDFSKMKYDKSGLLEEEIKAKLTKIAEFHKLSAEGDTISTLLTSIVKQLSTKLDKKKPRVAILIDNFDRPIINSLENPALAKENKEMLTDILTVMKTLQKYIAFTFVTGITKFSHSPSFFGGRDHLVDITIHESYAAMLGFTEQEIKSHYNEFVEHIAKERSKPKGEILDELRSWHGGYNFSEKASTSDSVYNPWSTMSYLKKMQGQNYFLEASESSFLAAEISKHAAIKHQLMNLREKQHTIFASKTTVSTEFDEDYINPIALLIETGYLTICGYNAEEHQYTLRIPNRETEECLLQILDQASKKT